MVNKITPDKRPALAFDDAGEVEIIQIALRTYKNKQEFYEPKRRDMFVNKINGMLDELDKVILMFNKKEK
tara:strand:- start:902 stop:1111 length:210 start_codon:yes stop_codon:yes gene_type:complete